MNREDHDRLVEIRTEIGNLISEADKLMRFAAKNDELDRRSYERAKAYWLGHMQEALDEDDEGDSFAATLNELDPDRVNDEDAE